MGRDISGGDSGARPVDARVARRRQDPLGRRLRKIYDDVVNENVPDEFLSILEQADERRLASGSNGAAEPGDEAGNVPVKKSKP